MAKAPVPFAPRILVVGDSHSTFWTGQNTVNAKRSIFTGVDVEHVGPLMAYSLPSRRSPAGPAIEQALAAKPGAHKLIVLCFGEVDIRAHIIAFAHLRGVSLAEIVEDVADCYLQFADSVVAKHGIPVALWGPPPSRPAEARGYIPAFPVTGAPMERNYATMLLSRALAKRCETRSKVEFFSLFDQLIGIDYRTLPGVLYDSTHLSNRYLPAALAELRRVFARFGLQALESCLDRRWEVSAKPRLVNVASAYWTLTPVGGKQVACRLDLISAYLLDEIRIAPLAIRGLGALRSIVCGDGANVETIDPGPTPDGGFVIKPAKRIAQRFVTLTFDLDSPPQPDLPAQAARASGLVGLFQRLFGGGGASASPPAPRVAPAATGSSSAVAALKDALPGAVKVMSPVFSHSLK